MIERILECRSCGQPSPVQVVDLGPQPLANALRRPTDTGPEPRYPLVVLWCASCTLVQLSEAPQPEELFRDYPYFSSFSSTMVEHAERLAGELTVLRRLGGRSLAVEIASNDGYLLQHYVSRGVPVLGIEPAVNVAATAIERGIPTLTEFFGRDVARNLASSGHQADVLHANNVLAHVPDVNGFVAGIAELLRPDGWAVVETPYVTDLVDRCEFDTIYHEHLFYYSLTALVRLFARHELVPFHAERIPIHGGSLRVYIAKAGAEPVRQSVREILEAEERWGVGEQRSYMGFAAAIADIASSLQSMLTDLKGGGARIAAYGAAAKGSTLLNTIGVGREAIDFVVDRNPHKQGLLMPGVHVPIFAPEKLLAEQPDFVLVLAWNFFDEIRSQQAEYHQRGGRFIRPIPKPVIV